MAVCLACSTTTNEEWCPVCAVHTINDTDTVTVTVPVDVLRLVVGMAERFVATITPDQRRAVSEAFYRATDQIEADAGCGPLTITGMIAAAEWIRTG